MWSGTKFYTIALLFCFYSLKVYEHREMHPLFHLYMFFELIHFICGFDLIIDNFHKTWTSISENSVYYK